MSNPAFKDGLLKIGKSSKDPASFRKDELYSTGVPEPFRVEYTAFVEDFDEAELVVHRSLDAHRPNKNREFFTCDVPSAIFAIRQHSDIKYEEVFFVTPQQLELERRELEAEALANQRREHERELAASRERARMLETERIEAAKTKEDNARTWRSVFKSFFGFGVFLGTLNLLEGSGLPDSVSVPLAFASLVFMFWMMRRDA